MDEEDVQPHREQVDHKDDGETDRDDHRRRDVAPVADDDGGSRNFRCDGDGVLRERARLARSDRCQAKGGETDAVAVRQGCRDSCQRLREFSKSKEGTKREADGRVDEAGCPVRERSSRRDERREPVQHVDVSSERGMRM